jgi:hypothetical protein
MLAKDSDVLLLSHTRKVCYGAKACVQILTDLHVVRFSMTGSVHRTNHIQQRQLARARD